MSLKHNDVLKADLSLFSEIDAKYSSEFCKIGVEFIFGTDISKKIQAAAKKLVVDPYRVTKLTEAISFLYTDSAKQPILPVDLTLKLVDLSLDQKILDSMAQIYTENFEKIRHHLTEVNNKNFGISSIPQFVSCEWRLDVEVDRRNLRQITNPNFVLKVNTTSEEILLNAQYHDLKHCCSVLEKAIKEIKSTHVRRIKTYIQ